MSRVLGGDGQPGCGESLVDVLVDGVECGAEFGWGLGLVGGAEDTEAADASAWPLSAASTS